MLEIFDTCRKNHNQLSDIPVWRWHILAHVCRRWRHLIFGSPRRLDLQILCTHGTPVRESLDIWPPLPIAIKYHYFRNFTRDDAMNLFTALEHHDRVCQVDLFLQGTMFRAVAMMMQRPFPALARLSLFCDVERPFAFPSGFLGGLAPRLQSFHLQGIAIPALITLLSSASDLVELYLIGIPQDVYISPESMVACLAGLPRLHTLFIKTHTATSHTDRIRPSEPSPIIRTSLPALTTFTFLGDSEYLEDLVTRIDRHRLGFIAIMYLNEHPDLQIAQLFKFIDRSEATGISLIRHVDVTFSPERRIYFAMHPHPGRSPHFGFLTFTIECHQIERQVSYIAQVLTQPSTMLSRILHLKLSPYTINADRYRDEWLGLFRRLSVVCTLHLSRRFARCIAPLLEDVPKTAVAEVLPLVDLIYFGGQPVSCVENFVAARQLYGRPVTIVDTEAEFDERLKSYVG